MAKEFVHFSTVEVAEGMRYADQHYGVLLDRALFTSLANKTGETWYLRGRPKGGALHTIKHEVLNKAHELQSADQTRRNAYSSSISKMFGNRRANVVSAKARREEEDKAPPMDIDAADALWTQARRPRRGLEAARIAKQRNDHIVSPH